MAAIVVIERGAGSVTLDGEPTGSNGDVVVRMVIFSVQDVGIATLHLTKPVRIPGELVDSDRFVRLSDALEDAESDLRREVIRKGAALANKALADAALDVETDGSGERTFFGVSTAYSVKLGARLALVVPEFEDGDTPSLPESAVVATADAAAHGSITVAGRTRPIRLTKRVQITVGDLRNAFENVRLDVRLALPELPALGFELPRLRLPRFDFGKLDPGQLVDFRPIDLPLPDVTISWTTKPTVTANFSAGDVSFNVSGNEESGASGEILVDKKEAGKIDGFQLKYNNENPALTVTGTVKLKTQSLSKPTSETIEIGPLRVKLEDVEATLDATTELGVVDLVATVTTRIGRVVVEAVEDPEAKVTLTATAETTFGTDGSKTKLTDLAFVAPARLNLDDVDTGSGALLHLGLELRTDPNGAPAAILKALGRIAVAVVRWFDKQSGGALSGVAEALAELAAEVARALTSAADAIASVVRIGVDLDPRTFRLRRVTIQPAGALRRDMSVNALGLHLKLPKDARPTLLYNAGDSFERNGAFVDAYVALVMPLPTTITLATDLWLSRDAAPDEAIRDVDRASGQPAGDKRLMTLTLERKAAVDPTAQPDIVLVAFSGGRPAFLKKERDGGGLTDYDDLADVFEPRFEVQTERLLPFFTRGKEEATNGGLFDKLDQYVEINDAEHEVDLAERSVSISLDVTVKIASDLQPRTTLKIDVDLRSFEAKLSGAETMSINGKKRAENVFGLAMVIVDRDKPESTEPFEQFILDFSKGDVRLALSGKALATLSYGKVAREGRGLVFEVRKFALSRLGLDLTAAVVDEPVTLAGVNMPFRFTQGEIRIEKSKLVGGAIAGEGMLPPDLVGEAKASIRLAFARDGDGNLTVESAKAELDKSGDPLVCQGTRFRFEISRLGLSFIERDRGFHFYFLLTGEAEFAPSDGALVGGLLKNLGAIRIVLKEAPLAGDPSTLAKAIEFQVELDPRKTTSLFDLFKFELRGIGFHPAAEAFDGAPAMSISGQVNFVDVGDIITPRFDFHKLWIAPPRPGEFLPQVRCDGLGVGVDFGGAATIEGTAIAVDGSLPSLYKPGTLPADVTAEGFLAKGTLGISGWARMSAAAGFLELSRQGSPEKRNAFFLYAQLEHLSEEIPTPVGTLFLREVGFGFGFRFTVGGIARAERAQSPRELIQILDEFSKRAGDLADFDVWEPQFDSSEVTLAMRALFTVASVSKTGSISKKEKDLANPIAFDVIAAFRTDFTFLMSGRAWLCTNYADLAGNEGASIRRNPGLAAYLYFSVPRKELLARAVAFPKGYVGSHPPLPDQLKEAIGRTRFSATLYIRPGLFHTELGWPYELGFSLGEPNGNFHLDISGGLVMRIEDTALLYGIAIRAVGHAGFGGKVGNRSLGASLEARVDFTVDAKFIAFIAPLQPKDTLFYGSMRIDARINFSVTVWLSFKVFGKRISLSASFTLTLMLTAAVEAVVALGGIAARAEVSVGVRAFGRTLCVGVSFEHGSGRLADARSRVAHFLALGLAADTPEPDEFAKAPRPEPSRPERTDAADERIRRIAREQDEVRSEEPSEPGVIPAGRTITATDFLAIVFPTTRASGDRAYVLQLVPRGLEVLFEGDTSVEPAAVAPPSTFFADPAESKEADYRIADLGDAKLEWLNPMPDSTPTDVSGGATLRTHWDKELKAEEGTLTLREFATTLFLGPRVTEPSEPFTEPEVRVIESKTAPLPSDPDAAADELARAAAQRRGMTGAMAESATVEERRGAVISSIARSVAEIAAVGELADGIWKASDAGIDARDFGLTFVVSEDDLPKLFDHTDQSIMPPTANFTLHKRILGSLSADGAAKVHLLNPRERHFAERPLRLAGEKCRRTSRGIALDWDLEPGFATSANVYDDPEFHLKSYHVVRHVELADQTLSAPIDAKAASPLRLDPDTKTWTLIRPDQQVLDDFSEVTFPRSLRVALLDLPQRDEHLVDPAFAEFDARFARWIGTIGADIDGTLLKPRSVEINYNVTAVDCAGTSRIAGSVEVTIEPPPARLRALTRFEMKAEYAAWPEAGGTSNEPSITFITEAQEDGGVGSAEARPRVLQLRHLVNRTLTLRVRRYPIVESGEYGAEGLSEGAQSVNQAEIDRKRIHDADLALTVVEGEGEFTLTVLDPESSEVIAVLGVTVGGGPAALKGAIGVGAESPFGIRMFACKAEQEVEVRGLRADALASPWTVVDTIVALKPRGSPVPLVETPLEIFEIPTSATFEIVDAGRATAGGRELTRDAGHLVQLHPAPSTTLRDLVERTSGSLVPLRDLERRVATRLDWDVRPGNAAAPVGGFHVFEFEPDGAPPPRRGDQDIVDYLRDYYTRHARYVLDATAIPSALRGLEPDALTDFEKVVAYYPSECQRRKLRARSTGRQDGGPERLPWFSKAESSLIWPKVMLRRSLFPIPDETVIAALFEQGTPTELVITVTGWPVGASELRLAYKPPIEDGRLLDAIFQWPPQGKGSTFRIRPDDVELTPARVREIQRAIVWASDTETEREIDEAFDRDRNRFDGVRLTIWRDPPTAENADSDEIPTPRQLRLPELGPLHPVLADTLALMRFGRTPNNDSLYIANEVTVDPVPEELPASFADWLGETPRNRDPYGWGIMRRLGIAAGVRVYDATAGRFLLGEELAELMDRAFRSALGRYPHGAGDANDHVGRPFADILCESQAVAGLAGFDGGLPEHAQADRATSVLDGALALAQISLRPQPDRLTTLATTRRPIEYVVFCKESEGSAESTVLRAQHDAVIDVMSFAGGLAAAPVTVLSDQAGLVPDSVDRIEIPLALVRPGDVVAIARVIALDGDATRVVRLLSGTENLKVHEPGPLGHMPVLADGKPPTSTNPFDRFAAPHRNVLAKITFGPPAEDPPAEQLRQNAAQRSWLRLASLARPLFDSIDPGDADGRAELVDTVCTWSERFLDHGAAVPTGGDQSNAVPGIGLGLATFETGKVRVAPDRFGRVSVLLPEKDRFGRRKRYAVRPYGRYRAFENAARSGANGTLALPPTLKGGFGSGDPNLVWADVSFPRTHPIDKPLILDARAVPGALETDPPTSLEIVVATPIDELIADSSIPSDAALSPHGIATAFWREFPHEAWADYLGATIDPLVPFGSDTVPEPNAIELVAEEIDGPDPIDEIRRERLPDLWRGAIVRRVKGLPYFFRMHAAAWATAGTVVSDVAATTLPEGPYRLTDPEKSPLPAAVAGGSRWDARPSGAGTSVVVRFDLAMNRFLDGLETKEAELWFATAGPKALELATLPDPDVAYRIALGSTTKSEASELDLATGPQSPEIEIAFRRESGEGEDAEDGLFAVTGVGPRLSVKDAPKPIRPVRAPLRAGANDWRLRFQASLTLPAPEPVPSAGANPGDDVDHLDGVTFDQAKLRELLPVLPRVDATLTVTPPGENGDWDAFAEAVAEEANRIDDFGSTAIATKLRAFVLDKATWVDTFGDATTPQRHVTADWPLGLSRESADPVEIDLGRGWRWKAGPDVWVYARRRVLRAALPADATEDEEKAVASAITALRDWWLAARRERDAAGVSFEPFVRSVDGALAEAIKGKSDQIDPPFDVLWRTTLQVATEAALAAEFSKAEGAKASTVEVVEALGRAEDAPSPTVDIVFADPDFGRFTSAEPVAIVLRRPPTKRELDERVPPDPVRAAFASLAADQLFGARRRPRLTVFRGFAVPLRRQPPDRGVLFEDDNENQGRGPVT